MCATAAKRGVTGVADARAAVPISSAQQANLAGQELASGAPIYNVPWRFDFSGELDPIRFKSAVQKLFSECDAFRLVLRTSDSGQPLLHDLGEPAGTFEELSFDTLDQANTWIDKAVSRPFDLSQNVFHSALITVGADRWIWYLNQHHMLTDGVSLGLIFDAVSREYAGEGLGALPAFLDYARGETQIVDAENHAFWRSMKDKPRPLPRLYGQSNATAETRAEMTTVTLGASRMEKLDALISTDPYRAFSRHQALFNVFSTVLASWINRVSGERNVPLGVVLHGRTTPVARETIGCFVELFPMSVALSQDHSFRDVYQDIVISSLELLRRATPGTSSPQAQSRFNAVINLLPTQIGKMGDVDVNGQWLDCGFMDPNHAFRLNVMELDAQQGVALAFAMNASVFDEAQRTAAKRHFFNLLDAFLDNPETRVAHVALGHRDDAATALVSDGYVLSEQPIPDVWDTFMSQANSAPDAAQIRHGDSEMSRAALAERAEAFAVALNGQGVKPGDRVGIHLTRSPDLLAAMLAVLKLGASFVPLDPGQTTARLAQIAAEADLRVVVFEPDLTPDWIGSMPLLSVDDVPTSPQDRVVSVPSSAPAYVLFTSGSTGVPKGVEIGRANLTRYATWANRHFAGDAPSVWALHSAIGFDLTITSMFAPLLTGGIVQIYREDLASPGLSVLDVFQDNLAEVVKLTPSHLRMVLEMGVKPGNIRSLVLGGEDLSVDLSNQAIAALGGHVSIFNEYGPTEATVGCMIHKFDPDRDTGSSVPIGRPAENTAIYLVDDAMNPVADGVLGHLYIAGQDRLAKGYLNRTDETAASFVSNPFQDGRMYESGDLASIRPDGVIQYHGRADDQLKLNGVRIERAEIERAARAVKGVDEAALVLYNRDEAAVQLCKTCGVPRSLPGVRFAHSDQCETCAGFEDYKSKVDAYFGNPAEFKSIIDTRAEKKTGQYDCVVMLSGGKDSTYAVSRLAEVTPRVLAATLDNGFISDEAKVNIEKIVERLGIDHRFISTPAMNDIFVDSLKRHANVCNGCFKTIYTLGLGLAKEVGAPTLVTGLSRGQLFETRLAPELFRGR